jgi:hypothetical protein
MTVLKTCLPIAFLGFVLAACGGRVQGGPGSSGSGGGASGANSPGQAAAGDDSVPADAGGAWDGWSGNAVSGATGSMPACQAPPVACGQSFPGATAFASSQEAANALVGRWLFCAQSDFYPPGQIGEEFLADGTYYELDMGPGGQPQRNLDPENISHWQIDLAPNGAVEIHTFGGGVQVGGGLSACPASLDLVVTEQRMP